MRTVKKTAIPREVMTVSLRKRSSHRLLRKHKRIWRGVKKMPTISEQCTCGRMRSNMFGTHGRLNTVKSSLIACQKSWKRSLKLRGENRSIEFIIQLRIPFINGDFRKFQIICTMVILTKSIPQKKCFFLNGKKLKIGRRWPEPAGTV